MLIKSFQPHNIALICVLSTNQYCGIKILEIVPAYKYVKIEAMAVPMSPHLGMNRRLSPTQTKHAVTLRIQAYF